MTVKKDYFNGKRASDKDIIHLYMLNTCTHKCKLCCNKLYSVDEIPVVTVEELKRANTICLTGGEPFLIDSICDFAGDIKAQYPNIKQVYVYTCGDSLWHWLEHHNLSALQNIDGVNISPKNKYDVECVRKIFNNPNYREDILRLWSSRIYVFPNVRFLEFDHEVFSWPKMLRLDGYESIKIIDREWQEDFEPESGIFRRLPILFN